MIPAFAQEDVTEDQSATEQTVAVRKRPQPKGPQYPMMEIKGKVLDAATNAPLAGVQVQTLGNNRYTAMTEEDGNFVISVPTFETSLFVHSPEYMSEQVAIDKHGPMLIKMHSDRFRPMYNNGTNILASNSFTELNTTSKTIEPDIQATLGADVRTIGRSGEPGAGAAMFIRGINSLNADVQPLIVVDGVIQDMQTTRESLHQGDYMNLFVNINPEDIDKVEVLKNGTAIYGAKGGNGVILITTKRGHSMATRIDANVGVGLELVPKLPSMMNADQFRIYATEMLGTYPKISENTTIFNFLRDVQNNNPYYNKYHNNTDWTKEVYHNALTQNYNINVQGGDNIGMYNLSLGYTDAKSTARENGFNRLNVRFNTDISITRKLYTRFDMSFTKFNRNVLDDGVPESFSEGTITSPTFLSLIKSPFLNPYKYMTTTGELSSTLEDPDDFVSGLNSDLTLANPKAILANGTAVNKNRVENTFFNATIAPTYEFNSNLKLTEVFSYTLNRNSQRYYRPVGGVPTFLINGIGRVQSRSVSLFSKEISVQSDTRLNFEKHLGAHFLKALVGFRYNIFEFDNSIPEGQYQSAGNDKTPNISNSMDYKAISGTDDAWKSIDTYAQIDWNYRNRYFLQGTLDFEANSRFGSDSGTKLFGVSWAVFPGIQGGWVLTNEDWFPKKVAVNYLQLHVGYDVSGNDGISNYAARTSFNVVRFLGNTGVGAQLNNIGNEKIKWEKTGKFNVGFRGNFFNNRVSVIFDTYLNKTTNLLTLKSFDKPLAGINNYWSNGGSLENRGFEATVTSKVIDKKNVKWEVGASMGHYNNEIKSLPNDQYIYLNGEKTAKGYTSSIYGTDNIATIVGQSVGVFYGYKTAGVFSTDAEASAAGNNGYLYMLDATGAKQYFRSGDVHFVDINNDGIISEADKTIIGNPNPDIYGNIFTNFTWKHLTLHLGFNYSLGNDVYNYQRSILEGGKNFYNQTTAMTNRWRYEGQVTNIPRISYADEIGNSRFSDRWIEDGSYLRLKTLRLTYNVPVHLSWLQGLAIWGEATNLFTLTHYLGSDPEFSISNSVLYQGIDAGNIAAGRAFTLGMRINL